MTDKTDRKMGPGTIEIDGEILGTDTFKIGDTIYTVRELTVDEGDAIAEAAKDDKGVVQDRLNTRMLLAKAIIEPPTVVDQVGKWGGRKFVTIMRAFNTLNSLPVENPTPPAG